jgi:hypothetical protein
MGHWNAAARKSEHDRSWTRGVCRQFPGKLLSGVAPIMEPHDAPSRLFPIGRGEKVRRDPAPDRKIPRRARFARNPPSASDRVDVRAGIEDHLETRRSAIA